MNARTKSLDQLDKNILRELQHNARISASEIGRRVGLSTPAVSERIAKLEQENIIQGYYTKINCDSSSADMRVFIMFRSFNGCSPELDRVIGDIPEIVEWYKVTGEMCMLLKAVVPNTNQLNAVLKKLYQYGETTTSIVLASDEREKAFEMMFES